MNEMNPANSQFRVRIGVTGHRHLQSNEQLSIQVQAVLADIERRIHPFPEITLQWEVVSCLADGADRIVVHEVFRKQDARLQAVIPLTVADYRNTFGLDSTGQPYSETSVEDSCREFEKLMADSRTQPVYLRDQALPAHESEEAIHKLRHKAYREAGEYVLRHSDFLIALANPDAQSKTRSTQEMIELAKELSLPTYIIDVSTSRYTIRLKPV
jgi:hypothetical protein